MLGYDGSFPENAHSTVIGDISEINSDDKGGQQPARIECIHLLLLRRVAESFGERVAVYFQPRYLKSRRSVLRKNKKKPKYPL